MEKLIDQQISRRVIVPISTRLINNQDLSYAIYKLTDQKYLSVLYLVIADDCDDLLEISRNMATMKAVTSANKLSVDVMTIKIDHWIDVLRDTANPNDIIVCQEEQTVIDGRFKTIPMSDYLIKNFDVPVIIMKGFYHFEKAPMKKWLHEVAGDLGFLVILAIFTWLQINFDQALSEKLAQILVFVSFIFEVGSIWAWYKFMFG